MRYLSGSLTSLEYEKGTFCVTVLMNASFHPPFVGLHVFVCVTVLNMGHSSPHKHTYMLRQMRVCSGVGPNHILHVSAPVILKPPPLFCTQSASWRLRTRKTSRASIFNTVVYWSSWFRAKTTSAEGLSSKWRQSAVWSRTGLQSCGLHIHNGFQTRWCYLCDPESRLGRRGSLMKPKRWLTSVILCVL